MNIINLIIMAMFVEAVIQAAKPLWTKQGWALTPTECVSMAVGAVIAVVAKINMLDGLVEVTQPAMLYALYALTGIALGRGPSFVHDLWKKLAEQKDLH